VLPKEKWLCVYAYVDFQMNEFKTSPGVDVQNKGQENGVKRVPEGTFFLLI